MRKKRANSHTDSHAIMEPCTRYAPDVQKKIARFNTPVDIHFDHYRHRLIDMDNLCVKGVIDEIVAAGILSDDSSEQVAQISHSQRKIPKESLEKTVVTITETGVLTEN